MGGIINIFIGLSAIAAHVAASPQSLDFVVRGAPDYSYNYPTDALRWETLGYDECSESNPFQSPVNVLTSLAMNSSASYSFDHQTATYTVTQKKGFPVWSCKEAGTCGSISVDGKKFDLLQFHAHSPSENAVDGVLSLIDVHLVHVFQPCEEATPELLVLGVFVSVGGEPNPDYESFWNSDAIPGDDIDVVMSARVLYEAAVGPGAKMYSFQGSLTTPPCSPGVNWLVLKEPVPISDAQYRIFWKHVRKVTWYGNYRPLMPLNKRRIYETTF